MRGCRRDAMEAEDDLLAPRQWRASDATEGWNCLMKPEGDAPVRYRGVIFDLFGTLIDNFSSAEYEQVLTQMAEIVGAPADGFIRVWRDMVDDRMTGLLPTIAACVSRVCHTLRIEAGPDELGRAARVRLELTRHALAPREGALQTLRRLREKGYKLGLISDCTLEVPALWGETQFACLFDVVVFSCVVGVRKPDPRIYEMACAKLEIRPQHCLYVGDGSNRELSGAASAGMHAVLLRVPHDDPRAWERAEAEEWKGMSVSGLAEVLPLVE